MGTRATCPPPAVQALLSPPLGVRTRACFAERPTKTAMSCAGGFEFPPEDEDATDAELELPDELLQWYHQANRAAAAAQSKGKRKAPELSAFQRVGLKMEVELFIKE